MSQLIHLYALKKGSSFRLAHEILVLIAHVSVEVWSRISGLNCGRVQALRYPEVIKLELILKLKIRCIDWLLADTFPQAANHCTLF